MGMVKGCSCGNRFYRGSNCDPEDGCYTINARAEIDYTYWRNTRICVDKFQESYFDFNIEESFASCPSRKKLWDY